MLNGQRLRPDVFVEPDERLGQVAAFMGEALSGRLGGESPAPEEELGTPVQPERQSRGVLYERILDSCHIPTVEPNPEKPTVTVEVVGDEDVLVGGSPIHLEGHALYLWNALLLSRRAPRLLLALRAYGGEATSTEKQLRLGANMVQLCKKFEKASKEPVILIRGTTNGRYYHLSPQVEVQDHRPPRDTDEGDYVPSQEDGASFEEPELTKSEMFSARDRDIIAITMAYKSHPAVQQRVQEYWQPHDGLYEEDPTMPAGLSQHDLLAYRLLSNDETRQLFEQLEAGLQLYRSRNGLEGITPDKEAVLLDAAAAYQALLVCNLRYVSKAVRRFPELSGVSSQDHFQNGTIGLSTAIRHFDSTRGVRFLTYADWYINQKISREMVNTGDTIHVSQNTRTEISKMNRTEGLLDQELGREPSPQQLAAALGSTANRIVELRAYDHLQPTSLDGPIDGDGDYSLADILPGPDVAPEVPRVHAERVVATIDATELTAREQAVLHLHYGRYPFPELEEATVPIGDDEVPFTSILKQVPEGRDLSLQEIGDLLGVTRERIRQIEKKGIEKLRNVPQAGRSMHQLSGGAEAASRAEHSA